MNQISRNAGVRINAGMLASALKKGARVGRSVIAQHQTAWAAVLGAVLVICVGVWLAGALNVWTDEAFTLHTTGRGPAFAWAQAIVFEGQPPLYFVVESLWRMADESSIAFARMPSVLFAAAAVAITVRAARRMVPRTSPFVVALVMALNPIVLWAAVEMRVYALVLLVGAGLTCCLYEGFISERPSRRAQIWFVIFAIAGLYTQYYVGFVLAAQFVTVAVLRRGALRAHAGALTIVALAFAPFVSVALMHVSQARDMVTRATFIHAAHAVVNAVFVYLLPHDPSWTGVVKLAGFGCAGAMLIALLLIGRPAVTHEARPIVVQWLVSLICFSLVFGAVGLPVDPLRHLVVLVPSSMLAALIVMSSLTRIAKPAAGVALIVFAAFAATQLWAQYHPLAKRGDWARLAATISAGDRSTPVAVFPAELNLPLSVYLPGVAVPIPRPMSFTLDYVEATSLTGEPDVARVLEPLRAKSDELWLVTDGEPCRDHPADGYDYRCGFLEAYMSQNYRLVRSVAFRGSLARLFVMKERV